MNRERVVNELLSRRQLLRGASCGFGSLALTALLAERARTEDSPLAVKSPHFTPRAKRVIFLYLLGGPSQVDLFDYKPRLAKQSGEKIPFSLPKTEVTVGLDKTRLLGPLESFSHRGKSGLLLSDLLPHLGQHADDICILRGMQSDSLNHAPAQILLHCGSTTEFWPSMGSWVSYGLGTENHALPGYIALKPGSRARDYGSAFLPSVYQGTPLQNVGEEPGTAPIRHLGDPELPARLQRRRLDFLQAMNRRKLARLQSDREMEGLIESFELAFRMQTETPKFIDLSKESKDTLDLYGIGEEHTDIAGRQCLLARRFAEAGVRFVEVTMASWDHHMAIAKDLPQKCAETDRPIAGLLTDLKQRGLLDDTLVLCAGEFGRTPHSQLFPDSTEVGREHNRHGFSAWFAGGGVRGGMTHGSTDEFGYYAVDGKVHIHDLHATILHLLGLDHERLTYRHAGRDFRLTDVYGRVVREILV